MWRPDLLRPGLDLIFCGYNPSLTSGLSGYHYAHPGNRFWRVHFAAGITDRLYKPEEDEPLLDLGFTNVYPQSNNPLAGLPRPPESRWRG